MDISTSLIVIAAFGILEFILCHIFRKNWIKFILPVVLLVLSVSLFIYGRFAPLEGLKDLAYMITGVFIFFGFLSSCAVALVFYLVQRKRKQK